MSSVNPCTFGRPPIPFRTACWRAAVGYSLTMAAMFCMQVGTLKIASRFWPRGNETVLSYGATLAVFLVTLACMRIGGRHFCWFNDPIVGWGYWRLRRRLFLSNEWLLEKEGSEWAVHQVSSPSLQRAPKLGGFRALRADLIRLRHVLAAGHFPEIQMIALPAGFMSEDQIRNFGFKARRCERGRIATVWTRFMTWFLAPELRYRAKLLRSDVFRDVHKFPAKAVTTRHEFLAGHTRRAALTAI